MPFGLSGSSSRSSQRVAEFQQPFLEQLFRQGARQVPGALSQVQQLQPQLQQQLLNPALQAFPGLVSGNATINPFLEDQISGGINNLNENFLENILPALRRGSTARAGFGASSGARGQLAEANAAGELLEAQGNFETNLRGNAFNTQLNGQLQALQLINQLINGGLGIANAPFSTLAAQGGILGNPIVLGESSSRSSGFNFG